MVASDVSRDDVFALMPHQIIDKIVGEPTYPGMKKWKNQMNANLIAVKTPRAWGRGKGHLGLLQDPVVFLARNGVTYDPPAAAPLPYPVIPPNATTAPREELRATNKVDSFNWDQYQHTQRIAVNIGAAAFDDWVIAELDDPDEGLNGVDIRTLYEHVMDRFATIS